MKLTTKLIEARLRAGRKARLLDGAGLYLQVRSQTNAAWVLRYVSPTEKRVREMGLGPFTRVSLAEARAKAAEARARIWKGEDPISSKLLSLSKKQEPGTLNTFGQAAEKFFDAQAMSRWRNQQVRQQWLPMLRRHADRIWNVPVDQVDQQMMVMILQPVWGPHNVTAKRLMHRVAQVLDYSRIMGWRSAANPARFRGELEYALPKRPANVNVRHFPAVPLTELPYLMEILSKVPGTPALAARYAILTASRPSETFNAAWDEIDLTAALWRIAGGRYKTGKEHIVPLSTAAIAVLNQCPRFENNPFIFVSPLKKGSPLSNMAVFGLFKRLGIKATLHGTARSTFSDWAHDFTETPHEVIEECLGHTLGPVARAYRRGAAIEKRRVLLELWAERITGQETLSERRLAAE
jgi:integrase